jgi:hypothetical protein
MLIERVSFYDMADDYSARPAASSGYYVLLLLPGLYVSEHTAGLLEFASTIFVDGDSAFGTDSASVTS